MSPSPVADALDALHLEGLQIISPEWRYLYVNQAAARQGRKPPTELIGKTMLECYPGIGTTPMFALLQRCMRERSSGTMENEFTYEDGQRASFEVRVRPCTAGIVIVSLDVTERKNVESRLEEAYRRALRDVVIPVICVHHSVPLVPVIGALDDERAAQMTETVLRRVVSDQSRVVIFDVAGVPSLDTAVAQSLLQTTAMIRLLGASTVLTGVSPAAANALIHLGVDLSTMQSTGDLAEGIEVALAKVGKLVVDAKR